MGRRAPRQGGDEAWAKRHEELGWRPGGFTYELHDFSGRQRQDYDAELRFASPLPSGDPELDRVVLRWYRPDAPRGVTDGGGAVLLVHTLHPDLPVATLLARGLRERGVHAFVIELPGYASRVGEERRFTGATTLIRGAQAVTDCRRAYDVIRAVLQTQPLAGQVEGREPLVAIQGTSLGGFIATAAAGLDGCFGQTFLLLSGGDGVDILENGTKDAFHVRGALRHYGYVGDKLRDLLAPLEPLNLAGRLDPETTWMFNAKDDLVIPADNARRLAEAIGLDDSHHIWLPGNHYTAFLLLAGVLERVDLEMRNHAAGAVPAPAREKPGNGGPVGGDNAIAPPR